VAGGDIHLTTQDGFDSLVRALGEKLHGAEDIPVVRDSDGFHVKSASLIQQLTDPDRAVKQAEFCVNMKVNEGGRTAQGNLISCQASGFYSVTSRQFARKFKTEPQNVEYRIKNAEGKIEGD
jgi:hypothetical protein